MKKITLLLVLFTSLLCTESKLAISAEVTEWSVPYEYSRPRDPGIDSLGRVWFCGQAGSYLAVLDPGSGQFRKYDLADGARPHNLIIDEQDHVWFAANTLPYIGRLNPADGSIQEFPMPDGKADDPHTLVFDKHGNIWFTAQWSDAIGRLNTDNGKVDIVELPHSRSRPYGIKLDQKGQAWIVLFGTNHLAQIDPETLNLNLVELPDRGSRPRRLEVGDDGSIWYGDYSRGMLGRYDPKTSGFKEWLLPGGQSARPYGMAKDHKGNIWLAEGSTPNRLVEFNVDSQAFQNIVDIPNAQGSIRHMYFDRDTQSIWFGEDSNYVGRMTVQ